MQDSGMQVLFQGNNLLRILQGLGVTIGISILSVLLSMICCPTLVTSTTPIKTTKEVVLIIRVTRLMA